MLTTVVHALADSVLMRAGSAEPTRTPGSGVPNAEQ
jgi:hypothetical protein